MLKLRAETAEDMAVFGSHLQDATIRVADIAWLKTQHRLALVCNRFMWEQNGPPWYRTRCGIHFESVIKAQTRGIPMGQPDHVLELLTVHATEQDGRTLISLAFAGGADLRLEAELIDAELADLGAPWETPNRPEHDD